MRITLTVDENEQAEWLARLDKLVKVTGLGSRQNVLVASLAQYRLDVQAEVTEKRSRKKVSPKELDVGEGSRPKNFNEVVAFFKRRGVPAPVEPKAQLFYDYYQSNGWKVGKNPCKNWGSCLTTWQQRHADWRKVENESSENLTMEDFLDWVKNERPSWYGKLRDIKNINDVDGYYIQEYKQNIGKF